MTTPKGPTGRDALLQALLQQQNVQAPKRLNVAGPAFEVFHVLFKALNRLLQFARVTRDALAEFERKGIEYPEEFETPEGMAKVFAALMRKPDVEFLQDEKDHTESLVYGQATLSMWSAFEVFVADFLIAVVKADPSRCKSLTKVKFPVADFYALDEDARIEQIVELARQEAKTGLLPGVAGFEAWFEMFDLKGKVEDLTKRALLEFAAVRNCLAHRKGIVDARFKTACGTSKLKIGDTIRLTSYDADRYHMAAMQYSATVLDRVFAIYEPDQKLDSLAASYLKQLINAESRQASLPPTTDQRPSEPDR